MEKLRDRGAYHKFKSSIPQSRPDRDIKDDAETAKQDSSLA